MSTSIKVDVSDLFGLVEDLANIADVIKVGASRALNRVTAEVRKETVSRITTQINLKESYVDGKLEVIQEATPQTPVAVIAAPMRGTFLSNFGARQQITANVWTPKMYAEKFGSLATPVRLPSGKTAQWIPRKGDALRQIPQGKKQAGIKAAIRAGSGGSQFAHVFFMPLRRGRDLGGQMGTFSRDKGTGKLKAKYSLSVDQMAKIVWRQDADKISKALGDKVFEEITADISKELKT